VDVGTILLHKVPLYKIHLSVPQGECPEGESVRVTLHRAGIFEPIRPYDEIRCGSEATLRGLDPGSLVLHAVSDWQGDRDEPNKIVWGSVPVTIVDENIGATIRLTRGVVLEGRFILPEGVSETGFGIRTRTADLIYGTRPPEGDLLHKTGDMTFQLPVRAARQIVFFGTGRGQLYVKQMRYNGVPVLNGILPILAGDSNSRLEIELDNKGAGTQVRGRVVRGAGTRRQVLVVVAPTGSMSTRDGYFTTVPENDDFVLNVLPGEYRAFATYVPSPLLENPEVFAKVLASAERVVVAPGEVKSITLRLIDLGK
jgi:hypothetical protein